MKYVIVVSITLLCGVKTSNIAPGLITVTDAKFQRELIGPLDLDGDQDEICSRDDDSYSYPDYQLKANEAEVTDNDNIVRPCGLKDVDCIRSFLQDNSRCYAAYGPAPDPLCLPQLSVYFPFSNMTLTLTNLRMTGMGNTEIVEFYFNKKTRNVVLALEMNQVNQTSQKTYYSYQRTAKESVILSDYISILFDSFTLTAVIPKIPNLRMEMAEIHAYLPNGNPAVIIGPKSHESSDPEVTSAFADYVANFPANLREAFIFQSQLLTAIFVQTYLCDFGLKLYSF